MTLEEAYRVLRDREICNKCVHSPFLIDGCKDGCDECDQAFDMAYAALRAQKEMENPKPLTLDELREMHLEPVWIKPINDEYRKAGWGIVNLCPHPGPAEPKVIRVMGGYSEFLQLIPYPKQKWKQLYGKTWIAYRYKPKEDDTDG